MTITGTPRKAYRAPPENLELSWAGIIQGNCPVGNCPGANIPQAVVIGP